MFYGANIGSRVDGNLQLQSAVTATGSSSSSHGHVGKHAKREGTLGMRRGPDTRVPTPMINRFGAHPVKAQGLMPSCLRGVGS